MKEKMCTLRYIAAFSYLPKVRLFEKESKLLLATLTCKGFLSLNKS